MTIRVRCDCGKKFQVADEQEGRKVRCPACQDLVEVPGEAAEASAYHLEKKAFCPKCRSDWPHGTELCTQCGHDFRTGKQVKPYDPEVRELVQWGWGWLWCWKLLGERTDAGKLLLYERVWLFGLPLWRRVLANVTKCNRLILTYTRVVTHKGTITNISFLADGPRQKLMTIPVYLGRYHLDQIVAGLREMSLFEVVINDEDEDD